MKAYTYIDRGRFGFVDKPRPVVLFSGRRHSACHFVEHLQFRPSYKARGVCLVPYRV